ncbi:SIMPL domain-containing protein [Bermanella marisrubri]|uniref:DUF541 domain-containing protein n=1 Tax=Bermanella marisrubri TaxID=207949 RepID=Q1N382_9GAMM|nr:SIMPL domain-containing protein [Bermanella marisrubri]EAT12709.1 hypothetical protein RED65_13532 [Oceanobacter sp. RED65] [Bermanella marisrubri]QIZ85171.1 SIMPL domain-containing protein [Bermanella marisrubri]
MHNYKWPLLAMIIVLISACNIEEKSQWTVIDTHGVSNGSAIATSHTVSVNFNSEALGQSEASQALKKQIAEFEIWANKRAFKVVPKQHSLRPMYQYHKEEGRELVGYIAEQQFLLEELSPGDYQIVLKELPSLNPSQLSLQSVEASEEAQSKLKAELISKAFDDAKATAKAMQDSAGLCGLQVASMNVQKSGLHATPIMMRMETQADGVMHKAQAEQEQSIHLQVSWRAKPCAD